MTRMMNRRTFLKGGATAALGTAALPRSVWHRAPFDLVIRGGTVVDGTGAPPFPADLGLVGNRIAALGTIDPEQGREVIDAAGWFVTPGFIDIHTHSDGDILEYPTADSRVHQGVTTEITGNCGSSAAPAVPNGESGSAGTEGAADLPPWTDVESYLEILETTGISLNHALLVGQGTLRKAVAGLEDRALSSEEMGRLLALLEDALDQGALGLSTGLEYVPGRFTPTEEIVALARTVARRGGLYASHIRNEEAMLLEAVDEAIQVGRESGARVQISHLKAAGILNWKKQESVLDLLEGARMAGVEVLADAYPYTAYSTGLTIFMPGWALNGGWEALERRLKDPEERARIRTELIGRVRQEPGDYDLIVINRVRSEVGQPLVGKSLGEIAALRGIEGVDALLGVLEEEEGSVGYIGHAMSPENVETVLSHPLVMVGSDGSSMAPEEEADRSRPHPRSYGAFPRVLGYYCRERQLFDLSTAVKKMTSMPADQVGLRDRGRIARGMMADLVIFDAAAVRDEATFEDPHRFPVGIYHVLVNGELVIRGGAHTGARPGAVIRRT